MSDTNYDILMRRFRSEFILLKRSHRRIRLDLSPYQAWCLLAQIQLASRHPGNTGETNKVACEIARQIQAVCAQTPALAELAEMGWHPENDVK